MDTNRGFKKAVNLLTLSSFLLWNLAYAAPEGGSVVQGSAQISQAHNQTVINQSSQNAVINWNSFNTASHEAVQFNQPNASSVALNRITNGLPTQFAGSLSANGQVWILNPAGVLFTNTARVDVAGLVATTHGILDANFMAGNYQFDSVPGFENSKIINNGLISVKDSGIVALVGPGVENNGVIIANLGKVHLASGSAFVLDLYGDQLINFGSSPAVQNGYVSNSGTIQANGGKVYMTANSAAGVLDNVVSMSGVIEANAVSVNQKGEIILNGGHSGTTKVSGKLKASGGGFIETSGAVLVIEPTTEIDAGVGGTWLIDPWNITVVAGSGLTNNSGGPSFTPTGTSTIGATLIINQLNAGTSVTLNTASGGADAGDITISSAITATAGAAAFTLIADNNININAALTLRGTFTATAAQTTPTGKINIGANVSSTGTQTYNQPVVVTANSVLTSTASNIIFNSTIDDNALRSHGLTVVGASAPSFLAGTTSIGGITPLVGLAITYPSLTVDATLAAITVDQLNKGTDVTLTSSSGNLTLSSPITQTLNPVANTLTLVSAANFVLGSSITLLSGTDLNFSAPSFTIDGTFAPYIATELNNNTNVTVTATAAGGIVITSPITVASGTGNVSFLANAVNALLDIGADVDTNGTQFYQAFAAGGTITLEPGVTIQGGGTITLTTRSGNVSGGSNAINIAGQIGTTAKRQAVSLILSTAPAPNAFNSSLNLISGATIVATSVTGNALGPVITFPAGINWDVSGLLFFRADALGSVGQIHVTGDLGTSLLPIGSINFQGGLAVPGAGLGNSVVVVAPGVSIWVATNLQFISLRNVSNIIIDNQTDFHVPGTLTLNTSGAAGAQGKVIITSTGVLGNSSNPSQINAISIVGAQAYPGTGFQVDPGAHIYGNSLTINGRGGNISLDNGTINAYHISGTMNIINAFGSTSAQINGVIGAPGDLVGSLIISAPLGITLNAPGTGIMTSGAQTYNGVVRLNSDQTLTNTSGDITFAGTVDNCPGGMVGCTSGAGPFSLTTNSASGSTVFSGIVGGLQPISFIDVTGATTINTTAITTTGLQIYRGAVTLSASPTLTSQTADITFNSTLNGAFGLTTSVINGQSVTFNGVVGGTTALTSLTTSATGTTNINGGQVRTSTGDQNYFNPVFIGADTLLGGAGTTGLININAGLDSANATPRALTLTTTAMSTLSGNFGLTNILSALTVTNASTINAANILTTTSQTYTGAVTLGGANINLQTNAGGTITFGSTIQGASNLTANASSTGTVNFNNDIGTVGTPLTGLTVTGLANINTNVAPTIFVSGTQTYNNNVLLNNILAITFGSGIGSTTVFNGTVNSTVAQTAITIAGNLIVGPLGSIGLQFASPGNVHVGSLLVNGTTLGPNTNTSGDQTYMGAVTLNTDETMTSTGGNITFNSTIDGDGVAGRNLTLSAPTAFRVVSFNGVVGGIVPLASLMVTAGNATAGQINIANSGITTTGTQTYFARNIQLLNQSSVTLTGSTITFDGPVPPALVYKTSVTPTDLTINGDLVLNATMNASVPNRLNNIFVSGSTTFQPTISGAQNSVGDQTYMGPVTSVSALSTVISSDSGNVVFGSTINTGGFFVANAASGSVGVTYNGNVSVGTLWTVGTANINTATLTANTGEMRFFNAVNLLQDATLQSTLSDILFAGTVDGGFSLTASAGTVTLGGVIGGSQELSDLTINSTVMTNINTNLIKTTGNQIYNSNFVDINNQSSINFQSTNLSGTKISFNGLVQNINTAADVTISGNLEFIGAGSMNSADITAGFIKSLDVKGTTFISGTGGALNTQFSQTYEGAVTLAKNSSFIVHDGGAIDFQSTVQSTGGPFNLTANNLAALGIVRFAGVVGVSQTANPGNINTLSVTGADIRISTAQINTNGSQTYTGPVTLFTDTTLTSVNSGINFNGTVDSDGTPRSLTLNAFLPTVLTGNIGSLPGGILSTLHIINETHINTGIINTTTAQLYDGVVILGANAVLTSNPGGIVTFGSTIDSDVNGPWDLTVNTSEARFKGNIGDSQNLMGALTVNSDIINFDGNVTSVVTSGTQHYTGAIAMTIGVDPLFMAPNFIINIPLFILADTTYTSTAGDIHFQSTVNGPANLVLNPFSGFSAIFQGNVGNVTPLASLIVNGDTTISGASLIRTNGDQIYSNIMTLNNNLSTLALTTGAIYFGDQNFPLSGVYGSGFDLSAVTNNAANGPTGAGITGIVRVDNFTVGGPGGANLSFNYPTAESFVLTQGADQAIINTVISPDFRSSGAIYCVNNFCSLLPVPPDNNPFNIPPTQIFPKPLADECGVGGCDNLEIIVGKNYCSYSEINFMGNDYRFNYKEDEYKNKYYHKLLWKQEQDCLCQEDYRKIYQYEYQNNNHDKEKLANYCKQQRGLMHLEVKNHVGVATKSSAEKQFVKSPKFSDAISLEHYPVTKHDMYMR